MNKVQLTRIIIVLSLLGSFFALQDQKMKILAKTNTKNKIETPIKPTGAIPEADPSKITGGFTIQKLEQYLKNTSQGKNKKLDRIHSVIRKRLRKYQNVDGKIQEINRKLESRQLNEKQSKKAQKKLEKLMRKNQFRFIALKRQYNEALFISQKIVKEPKKSLKI